MLINLTDGNGIDAGAVQTSNAVAVAGLGALLWKKGGITSAIDARSAARGSSAAAIPA